MFKVLSRTIEDDQMKSKEIDDMVNGVENIRVSIQQLIKKISNAKENQECAISLSVDDMGRLKKIQLQSRKADKELNPIRFLFHAYEPKYWCWEVVELVRRIMLTAVICAILSGSTSQIVISMLFSMGFLFLYSTFQPYWNFHEDISQTTGQYMIFLVMFASLVLQSNLIAQQNQRNVSLMLLWSLPAQHW